MPFAKKFKTIFLPNLKYLRASRFRRCGCCLKKSLILSLSEGEEFKKCIRCLANLRYEMLAEYIRLNCRNLANLEILELDPDSPLRPILEKAKKYVRTFYSSDKSMLGSIRKDGARCEDITHLTFSNESFDLIISSDVLEHIPNLEVALHETERVLRPGGFHIFTVPPRAKTKKRAEVLEGEIKYLFEPEFHSDPLNSKGILTYWDLGPDMPKVFSTENLELTIVTEPRGKDMRILWKAEKIVPK